MEEQIVSFFQAGNIGFKQWVLASPEALEKNDFCFN